MTLHQYNYTTHHYVQASHITLHIAFGDNPPVLLKLSIDALVSVGRPELCQDFSDT